MNIYLDDERPTPPGFYRVYTAWECIDALKQFKGQVEILSLDHDLGPEEAGTGYDVVMWLEEQAFEKRLELIPETVLVHSANPVGKAD